MRETVVLSRSTTRKPDGRAYKGAGEGSASHGRHNWVAGIGCKVNA